MFWFYVHNPAAVYTSYRWMSKMIFSYLAFAEGGQSLKMQTALYYFGGRYGDWLDLFTWSFRDILGRLTRSTTHCHRRREQKFTCVLSLPQWRCCRNFEPLVSHTNVIKGSGIIQNRIPQIVVPGLHCACPNARTTNDELPKRELEYGLKDIGKKAFRLKRKQHEELQSRKTK